MPKKEMNTLVVGTNEYEIVDSTARSSISSKQDTLVSGTNIKTVNNNSLLGSGNINISGGENNVIESISVNSTPQTVTNKNVNITVPTATSDLTNDSNFVASSNLKTINNNSLVGSGDITVQDTLVSGTNIKTINNESLLGSGNIEIAGMYLGDDTDPATTLIDADLLDGHPSSYYASQQWVIDYINALDANNVNY